MQPMTLMTMGFYQLSKREAQKQDLKAAVFEKNVLYLDSQKFTCVLYLSYFSL